VHGASVGEMLAVVPLIDRIRARGLAVLVTSGTVTSAALAGQRLPDGAMHQFIPVDVPSFAARFLDYWRPDLALFVESDLWPNMLIETSARGVPVALINARLSERSFRRWRRLPATIGDLVSRFDLVLARTPVDAELCLLYRIAPLVFVGGSLIRHGGQNPIEPAKLKTAILHGPHVWNFADIYAALDDAGGAVTVAQGEQLGGAIGELLCKSERRAEIAASGHAVVEASGGALLRTLDALEPYLAPLQRQVEAAHA
jgi:3-deoxy-D-manno-octulosonic-acid transferase